VWVGEKEGGYKSDLTWAMGDTPFGFLSDSNNVSFSQRDSAARNSLLSLIDSSLSILIEDIDSFVVIYFNTIFKISYPNRHSSQTFNHELYSVLSEVSMIRRR